jgi:pSer/pThr/pTyr-binding forkhead associated (FHA) protein
MDCKLILETTGGREELFVLKEGVTSVGRDSDNDIQVMSDSMSRHHVKLTNMYGVCQLEDLGSSNGTYVNDERITAYALNDGDKVRLGESQFRFEVAHSEMSEDGGRPREYSDRTQYDTVRMKTYPAGMEGYAEEEAPLIPVRP